MIIIHVTDFFFKFESEKETEMHQANSQGSHFMLKKEYNTETKICLYIANTTKYKKSLHTALCYV